MTTFLHTNRFKLSAGRGLWLSFLFLASMAPTLHAQTQLVVTGDSFTRRTGTCPTGLTYGQCDAAGLIPHDQSYGTYTGASSKYEFVPVYNSGRGGDTCTTKPAYTSGPHIGQGRGLYDRLDATVLSRSGTGSVVSLLIGINDVNRYNESIPVVGQCLKNTWGKLISHGRTVIAMTYPPISSTTTVFAPLSGSAAQTNTNVLNEGIRNAVAEFNALSTIKVILVDLADAYDGSDPTLRTVDGVHPNAAGAYLIARKWYTKTCALPVLTCGTR